ncbi:MAG: NBR1-Ig-like domain-containing protein [Flexilinea sp.]
MMMKKVLRLFVVLTGGIFLISCSAKVTETPTVLPTAMLPTRSVATVEPEEIVENCVNSFLYIDDVNYPDGTVVEAGSVFMKEWEVQNNGSCDWTEEYRLRFVSGEQMSAPDFVSIPSVTVGNKGKLSVELKTPEKPGTYRSTWKAFGSDNRSFGETIYVEIVVN